MRILSGCFDFAVLAAEGFLLDKDGRVKPYQLEVIHPPAGRARP
jgi:hypothetical protein